MYQSVPASLVESLRVFAAETIVSLADYMPAILGALLILIVGSLIANTAKALVIKVLSSLHIAKAVKKTPIEHFLKNAEIKSGFETIVGTVVYWLIMLVVLQSVVTILGLDSLSLLLAGILGYFPRVLSAVVVLFFGVLLAGLFESFVKGAFKTIEASSSRMFGKIASYLVITVTILAAISELGIANEFILILFVGFVAATSLAAGLAFGLGGKDVVRDFLSEWYKRNKKG